MSQIDGPKALAAGSNPGQYRVLGWGANAILDNTLGNSSLYYINGVDKPENQGQRLTLGPGPHIGPGENLYIVAKPTSSVTMDSDDTSSSNIHIQYARYTASKPRQFLGTDIFSSLSDRNNTTNQGGISDDPSLDADVPSVAVAFGPAPANEVWTLYGAVRIQIDDTTA